MAYELSGTIKLIMDTQTFGSGFTKREFVVTDNSSKYPQEIKFELVKDRCSWLDTWKEGDEVNVHFDIRGNEHKERYYVNLQAWKLERTSKTGAEGGGDVSEEFGEPPPDMEMGGGGVPDPF